MATALHIIEEFIATYTPLSPEDAAKLDGLGQTLPDEPLESLHFGFQHSREGSRVELLESGWRRRQIPVFKVHKVLGDRISDLAALLISPVDGLMPLPYAEPATFLPREGQEVFFLGHYRPAGTPTDTVGQPAGLAVSYAAARVLLVGADFFLLDAVARPGMSGGPVIEPHTGKVLGIITEAWPSALTQQRVGKDAASTLVIGHPHLTAVARRGTAALDAA